HVALPIWQSEVLEAAAVDGAGSWRCFRHVTLPLLLPSVMVGTVLSTILAFMAFDQVVALTGGGPSGASETVGTHVYEQAFVTGRYGYSAAVALMLVAVVFLGCLVQLRLLRSRSRCCGGARGRTGPRDLTGTRDPTGTRGLTGTRDGARAARPACGSPRSPCWHRSTSWGPRRSRRPPRRPDRRSRRRRARRPPTSPRPGSRRAGARCRSARRCSTAC